jgi:hypothetical protein
VEDARARRQQAGDASDRQMNVRRAVGAEVLAALRLAVTERSLGAVIRRL